MYNALGLPDAAKTVLAWGENHPEFCPILVDFVAARIFRADKLAESYDQDEPESDKARDRELRKHSYTLGRKALTLAAELDPGSHEIQRLLAKTEEVFCEFDASRERLNRVLKATSGDKNAALDMLLFCRKLRGRVGFLSVEEKLGQKGASLGEDAVQRLQAALKDLKDCAVFLDQCSITDRERKRYHVMHDQARASLTLAEVELELGKYKNVGRTSVTVAC